MTFFFRKNNLLIDEEKRLQEKDIIDSLLNLKFKVPFCLNLFRREVEDYLSSIFTPLRFSLRVNKQKDLRYLTTEEFREFDKDKELVVIKGDLIFFREEHYMSTRYWNNFMLSVHTDRHFILLEREVRFNTKYLGLKLIKESDYFKFVEVTNVYYPKDYVYSFNDIS